MRHSFCSLILLSFLHAQSSGPVSAALEGDIVDSTTNAPISLARVRLEGQPNEFRYAKADRQGHFALANLPPGRYTMTVDSPRYLQSSRTLVDLTSPSPARSGAVIAGRAIASPSGLLPEAKVTRSVGEDGVIRAQAVVPMLAYATIVGTVTDPYGLPLANGTVSLFAKASPRLSASPAAPGSTALAASPRSGTQTDDRGQYRISYLQPGTYWVAAAKGYGIAQTWESSHRTTYFPAAFSLETAQPLELAPGQLVRADIRILRQAGVRVAGKLIKPGGAADSLVTVPGNPPTSLLFTNIALVPHGVVPTNPNGPFTTAQEDFEFHDVVPGEYTLMALTRDAAAGFPNQKPMFGLLREIEVGDRDMLGYDLQLEPLRDLAGQVTFGAGCQAAPLDISANGSSPVSGPPATVTTAADGTFVLTGLTTGKLHLNVSWRSQPGFPPRVSSIRLGKRDVLADGLEIPYLGNETLKIAIDCPTRGRRP
jgi:hypothetical protein